MNKLDFYETIATAIKDEVFFTNLFLSSRDGRPDMDEREQRMASHILWRLGNNTNYRVCLLSKHRRNMIDVAANAVVIEFTKSVNVLRRADPLVRACFGHMSMIGTKEKLGSNGWELAIGAANEEHGCLHVAFEDHELSPNEANVRNRRISRSYDMVIPFDFNPLSRDAIYASQWFYSIMDQRPGVGIF